MPQTTAIQTTAIQTIPDPQGVKPVPQTVTPLLLTKSGFKLQGQVHSFIADPAQPGRVQSVTLRTPDGSYTVKLAKDLRHSLPHRLQPGDGVVIFGKSKFKSDGRLSLKAKQAFPAVLTPGAIPPTVEPTAPQAAPPAARQSPPVEAPGKSSPAKLGKVMVCSKSKCWKRGGQAICGALTQELADRGLADQVSLKTTGCMGKCKSGPNVVFMPDKARYGGVSPRVVPELVDRHLAKGEDAKDQS